MRSSRAEGIESVQKVNAVNELRVIEYNEFIRENKLYASGTEG